MTGATRPIAVAWARRETFPAPVTPNAFKPRVGTVVATYPTADVAAWCVDYLFGDAEASGIT